MQSRKESLVERLCDVATGFGISWILTLTVLPGLYGYEVSLSKGAEITAIFTTVSICRGYLWRRFFNRITERKYKAMRFTVRGE